MIVLLDFEAPQRYLNSSIFAAKTDTNYNNRYVYKVTYIVQSMYLELTYNLMLHMKCVI